MKRLVLFLLAGSIIILTSCETTKEISLRQDGSGIFTTTTDMSSVLGMAKMAGEGQELDKLAEEKAVDTTVSMEKLAEELSGLSPEEINLVKKGTLGLTIDMQNDKFLTQITFPFSNTKDIPRLDKLSSKIIQEVLKKQLDSSKAEMPTAIPKEGMPDASIDDYYNLTFSKKTIERKLIQEKYANVATDENMKALKELSSMGVGNNKLIIYLPKPAKKTEGKNLTLSDDKKKVTIESSTDDFFEDGKKLEFKIEF